MYLHCNMQPSTDLAESMYLTIRIFKLNLKYLGPQDLRQWSNSAFTFILCFTLLGSMCFGALPSIWPLPWTPFFNKRCLYNLSSNLCAMVGLVQPFLCFLPPLWADSIKSWLKNWICGNLKKILFEFMLKEKKCFRACVFVLSSFVSVKWWMIRFTRAVWNCLKEICFLDC